MNKLLITVFVMTLTFFSLSFSDSNGIWTHAEDIKSGVFGDDEIGGDYTFNDIVYFNEDLIYKSELIENLFLNRSGDSMSGTLNMQNNNITNVEMIRGDRVELAGASYIDRVVSQKYFSNGSTSYYLNPAGTSKLNNVEIANSFIYKGEELNNKFATKSYADSNSIDYGSCRSISRTGSPPNYISRITCNSDEILVNGGGECAFGGSSFGIPSDRGLPHSSRPVGLREWVIDCYQANGGGEANSKAVGTCCKLK